MGKILSYLKTTIFFIIFSLFISLPLYAQINLENQYKAAEEIYNLGLYYDAITEYKRLLLFDSGRQYEYEANLKIALCYKVGGKYDDAVPYFAKAEKSAPGQNEKFDARIQIVRVNILRRTEGRALELLDILEKEPADEPRIDEINYWRGWTFMFTGDFGKAAEKFEKSSKGEELKKISLKADSAKYSVTFAKVISYILPGAGEIYTGELLSGIISFGWNALCAYLTVNAFAGNRILDGILIGDLLFLRFYRGNIQNAGKFAVKKNLEIINNTLSYIQNNYQGIKP